MFLYKAITVSEDGDLKFMQALTAPSKNLRRKSCYLIMPP